MFLQFMRIALTPVQCEVEYLMISNREKFVIKKASGADGFVIKFSTALLNILSWEANVWLLYQNFDKHDNAIYTDYHPPKSQNCPSDQSFVVGVGESITYNGQSHTIPPGKWDVQLLAKWIGTKLGLPCSIDELVVAHRSGTPHQIDVHGYFKVDWSKSQTTSKEIIFNPGVSKQLQISKQLHIGKHANQQYWFYFEVPKSREVISTIQLKRPTYSSYDQLCKDINQELLPYTENRTKISCHYVTILDAVSGLNKSIIEFQIHDTSYVVILSEGLNKRLQFFTTTNNRTVAYNNNKDIIQGEGEPYDFQESMIHAFWILSDVVEDQIVGDKLLPLLRILPNNAPPNVWHVETCDAYYLPVARKHISTIEIRIQNGGFFDTTDNNSTIVFERDVVVVLHFRQR